MLVLAELIVCSVKGFACILAKWFWPTVMSLSLTYGSPEASCNKRADTYLGRRSASLTKEFWTLCIFVITVSETRIMVETIPYSNIGLMHQSIPSTNIPPGSPPGIFLRWSNSLPPGRNFLRNYGPGAKKIDKIPTPGDNFVDVQDIFAMIVKPFAFF